MEDVQTIVKLWLEQNGYDGLFSPMECCCELADLMPCCEYSKECKAGYKVEGCDDDCGQGCKFHIVAEKPAKTEERCKHNGKKAEREDLGGL